MNRDNSRSRGTTLLAVAVVVLAGTAATGRDGAVELGFSALGRSFFDGAAPVETRVHRSDGQCQRSRPHHLLYPATTCTTPRQGTRLWESLLLTYC
jgi:hypothetical protein